MARPSPQIQGLNLMTDVVEPTYSQIEAASRAFDPKYDQQPAWVQAKVSVPMEAALMAAQTVDKNIYGHMHCGGSVSGVTFMAEGREGRDKIMGWAHDAEHVLPAVRERLKSTFNEGINAAIAVMQAGVHAAAQGAGFGGIQDDDQLLIAAMERLRR